MAISNGEALENLIKQREQILDQLTKGQSTLLKIEGAIEVLQQLSEDTEETEEVVSTFDEDGEAISDGVTGE